MLQDLWVDLRRQVAAWQMHTFPANQPQAEDWADSVRTHFDQLVAFARTHASLLLEFDTVQLSVAVALAALAPTATSEPPPTDVEAIYIIIEAEIPDATPQQCLEVVIAWGCGWGREIDPKGDPWSKTWLLAILALRSIVEASVRQTIVMLQKRLDELNDVGRADIRLYADLIALELVKSQCSCRQQPITITWLVHRTLGNLLPTAEAAWVRNRRPKPIVLHPGKPFVFDLSGVSNSLVVDQANSNLDVAFRESDHSGDESPTTDARALGFTKTDSHIAVELKGPLTDNSGNHTYSITLHNVTTRLCQAPKHRLATWSLRFLNQKSNRWEPRTLSSYVAEAIRGNAGPSLLTGAFTTSMLYPRLREDFRLEVGTVEFKRCHKCGQLYEGNFCADAKCRAGANINYTRHEARKNWLFIPYDSIDGRGWHVLQARWRCPTCRNLFSLRLARCPLCHGAGLSPSHGTLPSHVWVYLSKRPVLQEWLDATADATEEGLE